MFLQTEGKLKGCWVMRIEDGRRRRRRQTRRSVAEGDEEPREKVIVRSDGTVTYVGKDMAYQFWKFGLLGTDFHYRMFEEEPTAAALVDDLDPARRPGRAPVRSRVVGVQRHRHAPIVPAEAAEAGAGGARLYANRPRTRFITRTRWWRCRTRRRASSATTRARTATEPFVEVSGRKGLGVKADDLLDRLTDKAAAEVAKRNTDLLGRRSSASIAAAIATAAVRYFMVKFSRGKVIVFDIDEALSFEGESGPYLQYAVVRANNIFDKLKERDGLGDDDVAGGAEGISLAVLIRHDDEAHELWGLVFEAARLDEIVEQAVRTLELSVLAKYAFGLAQAFNGFYHKYPILNEEREDARAWRAAAVAYYSTQLTHALGPDGHAASRRKCETWSSFQSLA